MKRYRNRWPSKHLRKKKPGLVMPSNRFEMKGNVRMGTGPSKGYSLAGLNI